MLHQLSLQCYRSLTGPVRNQLMQRFRREQDWPAAVLFYHLVTENANNNWTTSQSIFYQQIDWLQQNTSVVSLQTILDGNQSSNRTERQSSITFDDGYSETVINAIPYLLERDLPCTFFVSTHFVETGDPFPHDVQKGEFHAPISIDQLQEISNAGIEIGCHTHTHMDLGAPRSQATLRREIQDSRHRLQDWTGQSIDFFSFPYGLSNNMSTEAINMVGEAGFKGFVSAYGAWNWCRSKGQHIRRIHADCQMESFLNWLEFDPRKSKRSWDEFGDCTLATPDICDLVLENVEQIESYLSYMDSEKDWL